MADGSQPITIVGAGLVGALLATVLARRGYRVTVYERYGDIRAIPSSGRSINLVATARTYVQKEFRLLALDVRLLTALQVLQDYGNNKSTYF